MEPTESLPLETAEEIILRWATEDAREKMIFQFEGDRQELYRYLQAVYEIQRSMLFHDHIIRIAMARLEGEFRNILISLPDSFAKPTTRRRRRIAVYDLRCIAERMISSGYLHECIHVHATLRKSAVDPTFQRLGINILSSSDVKNWIRAARFCVGTLFAREKKLCEKIFDGLGPAINDACFMETVKEHAIQLLNSAEAITISISPRDPKKLFKILDLHGGLKDLMPDIHRVFDSKSCECIRIRAAEALSRLAEAARASEFENAVLREPSKVPVQDGAIHLLTMDVMSYLSSISDYRQTMNELVVSKPSTGSKYSGDPSTPDMDFAKLEGTTPLTIYLIRIIGILQLKLEGKSKCFKDVHLPHLFMMNNIHFIVEKLIWSLELREMIGEDYLKKLIEKFQQAAASYQRTTWGKVLYCLREEGLPVSSGFSSKVLRSALRERFKAFNAMIEEVHRTQAIWLIPDYHLRLELRNSISKKLIPAYKTFLERFRKHIESTRHPENYIKYSVKDLKVVVSDFFLKKPLLPKT